MIVYPSREPHRLQMDLRHQRTGGVDGLQASFGRRLADGRGHAVSAVQHRRPLRHLLHAVHEDDAALAEALHHRPIVDDLVVDVERRAKHLERPLQALDGHVDAGAETARIGQDDFHFSILLVVHGSEAGRALARKRIRGCRRNEAPAGAI